MRLFCLICKLSRRQRTEVAILVINLGDKLSLRVWVLKTNMADDKITCVVLITDANELSVKKN